MDPTPHSAALGDNCGLRTDELVLGAAEVRVLGCLIEKAATTPDDYPLTPNAAMRAANQSTSRDPVVSYDLRTIESAATSLKARGLLRFVHMASGRAATRYRHCVDDRLGLDDGECAVLGLLMLRGPQTVGELKTRAERLHGFVDLREVSDVLERLARRPQPVAVLLDRHPGQKESRWTHLLHGSPVSSDSMMSDPVSSVLVSSVPVSPAQADRVGELERRIAVLEIEMSELRTELGLSSRTPESA